MSMRRWRRREVLEPLPPLDLEELGEDPTWGEPQETPPEPDDWFGPSEPGEEPYAARQDVSLAAMLMLGAQFYQRIDGMGLARQALDAPISGDARRDLSVNERALLANGRAWCLLVHGDLGHYTRRDDPFVLADAERNAQLARSVAPGSPRVETTFALLRLRQRRVAEAMECGRAALDRFARLSEHERNGETQGVAILATVTLALVTAAAGDLDTARALGVAARAVRTPMDLDQAAFDALMAELDGATAIGA